MLKGLWWGMPVDSTSHGDVVIKARVSRFLRAKSGTEVKASCFCSYNERPRPLEHFIFKETHSIFVISIATAPAVKHLRGLNTGL